MSLDLPAAGAAHWLTTPSTPQVSLLTMLLSAGNIHTPSPLTSLLFRANSVSWRPLRKAAGQRSQKNKRLQAANQRRAQTLLLQRGERRFGSVQRFELCHSMLFFKCKSVWNVLLSCPVTQQRTQTRLLLQLWPQTSVCSGESTSITHLSKLHVFNMTVWYRHDSSCIPQVPEISESRQ